MATSVSLIDYGLNNNYSRYLARKFFFLNKNSFTKILCAQGLFFFSKFHESFKESVLWKMVTFSVSVTGEPLLLTCLYFSPVL